MKTSKTIAGDSSSSRRAQPIRQARTNPPRASIPNSRTLAGSRSLAGDLDEKDIDIFPAITHFADAITALPKELVRHFTLLKEVDAKTYAPEEQLHRLVEEVLNTPPPSTNLENLSFAASVGSAHGSVNGSALNGYARSVMSLDITNPALYDPANFTRRQRVQETSMTMSNMLVALDEKNHVISTAWEALNKQLRRLDDCMPYLDNEISEEARYGSTTHWAYPENRIVKPASGTASRKEIANVAALSAAAQAVQDEVAARSDARKQALLEKKKGRQPAESDFDDNDRHRKTQGNSKVRKPVDANPATGLTNGSTSNPPKRRKVEKGPVGGAVMERSISGVFGNGASKGKVASPRATPNPEAKKRSRAAPANGVSRKRNGTITSAMSPSLASSPIRSTFPDIKPPRPSPPPTNNGRPSGRGRQNSLQSIQDKRPPSVASNKQNGISTPNPEVAALATGRSIPEVKSLMKETAGNSKEHLLEDVNQTNPEVHGALLVGNRKDSIAKDSDVNGDQPVNPSTTTKSGRASKPSTPAIPTFPESARSRSARNNETTSSNKRSHKKGAGQSTQHLVAQQSIEDEAQDDEDMDEDGDADANEPRYCICNQVSFGEMVGCDNDTCVREWFHLGCVGLRTAPKANVKWYCDECKEKMKLKRFNSR